MNENTKWFKEAKYGMMIHFGLYSLLAGEYKGQRMGSYNGEWIQNYLKIPCKEYEELAKAFNPIYFNADEWVDVAIKAGMKYIVVTTKHHDGFALFKSDFDNFNVVDATPFKRDIIKELADACHKKGIKFGLYYSQCLDWHEKNGAGYEQVEPNADGIFASNTWDFPDNKNKNFTECFERKIKPQVKEILTKYGDIDLIWFDCAASISKEQSIELYNMVKQYQPRCLVNSRIGLGEGYKCDYRSLEDNEIPDGYKDNELLIESACTLNDTWGYKSYDQNWKSAEKIFEIKKHLNSRNINYLLNVGPDYLGRIPGPSVDILMKVKELIDKEEK